MKKTINKTLLVLAVTTSISLTSTLSYAAEIVSAQTKTSVTKNSDGTFSKKTITTGKDSKGTTTSSTNEVKSKLDTDGDYKKSIENKTVVDPRGLMNKQTTTSKEEMERDNGDDSYRYTKKVNGKVVKSEELENNKK